MVSFKEDTYFDPESKKFYNGIYVSAYVSKENQPRPRLSLFVRSQKLISKEQKPDNTASEDIAW